MRTRRPLAATALSALALCALTACGPDHDEGAAAPSAPAAPSAAAPAPTGTPLADLPVAEVVAESRAAGAALTGLTLTVSVPGHRDGPFNGTFAEDGAGACTGRFTVRDKGSAELLRSGGRAWIRPDKDYLAVALPDAPAAAAGKWLPVEGGVPDYTSFCDLGVRMARQVGLDTDGSPGRDLAKAGSEQINGAAAVVVTMTDRDGTPVRYAVAAQGEPRLLAAESGSGATTVRLGDFDRPVQAAPPAEDQVFRR
ncbi:hypothetical protein ACFVT9_20115 [Kitasatospora cineracea]|uniref:hypothetical protein n=1 Tax=Kitasatospora cineracea TaxID=88074 RepID=UPI0036DE0997